MRASGQSVMFTTLNLPIYGQGVKQAALLLKKLINQIIAGWSSPVARQAHNLKAAGSNPAPATNLLITNRSNASYERFFNA